MTLIPQIDGVIIRSTIGIVGASKIQHWLYTIISFALSCLTRLNKQLCLNITDETLLD